jgi:hypothetical protein
MCGGTKNFTQVPKVDKKANRQIAPTRPAPIQRFKRLSSTV